MPQSPPFGYGCRSIDRRGVELDGQDPRQIQDAVGAILESMREQGVF